MWFFKYLEKRGLNGLSVFMSTETLIWLFSLEDALLSEMNCFRFPASSFASSTSACFVPELLISLSGTEACLLQLALLSTGAQVFVLCFENWHTVSCLLSCYEPHILIACEIQPLKTWRGILLHFFLSQSYWCCIVPEMISLSVLGNNQLRLLFKVVSVWGLF